MWEMAKKIKITSEEKHFALMYLKTNNPSRSYFEAYKDERLSSRELEKYGRKLLTDKSVQRYIEHERSKLVNSLKLEMQDLIAEWKKIGFADVNEIVQIRRVNCRYCFGENFNYQYFDEEEFLKKNKSIMKNFGGVGFTYNRDPNPECPRCGGEGIEHYHINDTRDLNAGARALYNGFEKIGENTRVLLRDRDRALENIAKILGFFDKNKTTEIVITQKEKLNNITDPIECASIYKKIMQG